MMCPQCGSELPANAPGGICPQCLMQAGIDSQAGENASQATSAHQESNATRFVPPTAAELSKQLPQLEILELIGQGGMGAVYKARQPGLDRLVAVKILPPHLSHTDGFAERFAREARALARLNHPNIVGVYDSGHVNNLYFFVMEYVDGVNLRQAMQAGKLAPEEAVAIVPQICDALQYAHDEGIVHRDIKPENVMVDSKGRVKIADFGLAKLLGIKSNDLTLTLTHQVMGTPRYMAPEQMDAGHNVDHRADIYSLGVVFYELLTGEVPMGRFEPPSKRVQIDVRLDEVVLRALDREPDKRYQQASSIKTDMETISTSKIVSAAAMPLEKSPLPDQLPSDDLPVRGGDIDEALGAVRIPAIGLVVVGVLTLLAMPIMVVLPVAMFSMNAARVEGPSEVQRAESAVLAAEKRMQSSHSSAAAEWNESAENSPDTVASPIHDQLRHDAAETAHADVQTVAESTSAVAFKAMILAGIVWIVVAVLPSLIMGGLIISGGWRMLSLRGYGLAVTASILALLPCQPLFFLGVIFGIWSLIVLSRKEVKLAFQQVAT